jgi:hypothetical protein
MKIRLSRYSLVFVLILICVINASGQILIGPTLGVHANKMFFDERDYRDLYKVKPDIGFNGGFSVSFRAQKKFFLTTSFLYMQRSKIITGKNDPSLSNKATLRYIDIPILYTAEFTARLKNDRVYKWYFGFGPTISYWLGGKGVLKNGDLNENAINPPDYDLHYKITFRNDSTEIGMNEMNVREANRIQLGLNASAGLIFEPQNYNKVMVNLRYSFGQSYLSRNGKGEFGLPGIVYYKDELKIRNQELILSVHYFMDLRTDQRKKGKSTSKIKNARTRR